MIEKCIETTKNTPEDEFNSLPDKDLLAKEVEDLNLYDDTHIKNENKIEYLNRLEASASKDKKIVNTESSFTEDKSNFILANSDGFCKGYKTSSFIASSVPLQKMIKVWSEIMNIQINVILKILRCRRIRKNSS